MPLHPVAPLVREALVSERTHRQASAAGEELPRDPSQSRPPASSEERISEVTLIPWTTKQFGVYDGVAAVAQEEVNGKWSEAKEALQKSNTAKDLLARLESHPNEIGIVINEVNVSQCRVTSQTETMVGTSRQFGGGAVYWGTLDKTEICRECVDQTPTASKWQDPIISLAHEMYHIWQALNYRGAKGLCTAIPKISKQQGWGSDLWLDWQLAIEQSCVNFEKVVADELNQPSRDDYWHYNCAKGEWCGMRTMFNNRLTPSRMTEILNKFGDGSAITIFCDTKTQRQFLSTQRLLEIRYNPWEGKPFDTAPKKKLS